MVDKSKEMIGLYMYKELYICKELVNYVYLSYGYVFRNIQMWSKYSLWVSF